MIESEVASTISIAIIAIYTLFKIVLRVVDWIGLFRKRAIYK